MGLEFKNNGGTYIQVDSSKATMYIYSKEEKEGFVKHESSTGKISYRRYVSAVSGYVTGAYFRDSNFGNTFNLVITDEEDRFIVQFYVEESSFINLALVVDNLDISNRIKLSIYKNKSENGKEYTALSMTYPDKINSETGKPELVPWGKPLPKAKKLRTGKWDFTEVYDEAYGRVEKFIESNDFSNNYKSSEPVKEEDSSFGEEVTDDDLPF